MVQGDTPPREPIASKWTGKGGGGRLTPILPGQVLNPTGRNQFSYRRDFERTIERLLRSPAAGSLEHAPEWMIDAVEPGMSKGEALAAATVAGALAGDLKHLGTVLKRIWPEVVKHEVDHSNAPPPVSPLENLNDEDRTTMLRLAQKAIRGGDTSQ